MCIPLVRKLASKVGCDDLARQHAANGGEIDLSDAAEESDR
jgi:hypothetical protein